MITVVHATAKDADIWRSLRRDGIAHYPEAFLFSLEQHDASDPADDVARLASGGKFLAYSDGTPVGIIGLTRFGLPSMRHRAELGPLYVTSKLQGSTAAKQLLDAATDYAAAAGQWQLELAVNEANTRAVSFYLRNGFTQYGRLPNAALGENGPEHDLLLLRLLRQAPSSFCQ